MRRDWHVLLMTEDQNMAEGVKYRKEKCWPRVCDFALPKLPLV